VIKELVVEELEEDVGELEEEDKVVEEAVVTLEVVLEEAAAVDVLEAVD
jgi:hypothetical protein